MMRRSPTTIKNSRSPTLHQKLSRTRARLASAAATTVRTARDGAALSDIVASRAVNGVDGAMGKMEGAVEDAMEKMRSPERRERRARRREEEKRRSAGIRDRINMFDSASASAKDDGLRRNHRHNTPTTVRRGEARRRGEEEPPLTITARDDPDLLGRENEKENERNRMPFQEKEGGRRKKEKSGRNPHYHWQRKEEDNGPENPMYRSRGSNDDRFKMEKEFCGHNDKKKNEDNVDNHWQQPLDDNNGDDDHDDSMDISARNRAAAYAAIMTDNSKRNDEGITAAAATRSAAKTITSRHDRKMAATTSSSHSGRKPRDGPIAVAAHHRRRRGEHGLIQSPLREHIQSVHDSAVSNAACTSMKEPFSLTVASSSMVTRGEVAGVVGEAGIRSSSLALAAVARWDQHEDMGHLETLGVMTTGIATSKACGGRKRSGASTNNSKEENAEHGRREEGNGGGGEAALDLLTSAAFLFKTSRRKLG